MTHAIRILLRLCALGWLATQQEVTGTPGWRGRRHPQGDPQEEGGPRLGATVLCPESGGAALREKARRPSIPHPPPTEPPAGCVAVT